MKCAFVFPGQGSQSIGMMGGFVDHPIVRETFDQASTILGIDLWQLVEAGPVEALNSTVNTQPLMLTVGYAVYRAWQATGGITPSIVAGHSLGEYTALVAAGALSFSDSLPLVQYRASCMQQAVPMGTGAMAAILGLDDDAVKTACSRASQGEIVEAVNFNAPSQVVIAGHLAAVERAAAEAKALGAKRVMLLPVSAPFHSSLLAPAADLLRIKLAGVEFLVPKIPVLNNIDVIVLDVPQLIKDALSRQACGPVRWAESIQKMATLGVTHIVECGPGKILSGMNKRINPQIQSFALTDSAAIMSTIKVLK